MTNPIGTCAYCNRPVQPGEQSEWVAHADCEQREREATEILQAELTQPCIVERAAMYDALRERVLGLAGELEREAKEQRQDWREAERKGLLISSTAAYSRAEQLEDDARRIREAVEGDE